MSSFICNPELFNDLESNLSRLGTDQNLYQIRVALGIKREDTEKDIKSKVKGIINALKDLNVLCVILQYKHHYKGVVNETIEAERNALNANYRPKVVSLVQLYKHIGCLLYQIEVDHLKELRELTNDENMGLFTIEMVRDAIACTIVENSSEYNEAKWS
jgi:hypothetical protein